MDGDKIHQGHVAGQSEILQLFEQAERFVAPTHDPVSMGQSGEGHYAFVTHSFADATRGAVGVIQVGRPKLMAAGH